MKGKLTKTQTTKRLVISAMFIAVSIVLNEITPIKLPVGGSVTPFSMVPLALLGWQYGALWGLSCGATMGVLDMVVGGLENFSYVAGIPAYLTLILFDYLVAYGVMGISGIFKGKLKKPTVEFALGAGLACVLRFICHFITGVTIWADYADGFANVWGYSLGYNASYMVPELIITVIGVMAIANIKPIMKGISD